MSIQRKIYEQNLKTEASIGPDHKYLGKDKKFGRSFYEKDGQLHVVKAGGTHVTNLGSTSVKGNAKMIKGLIKDHVELDEAIKVGDTVHLGHGTKGGTGVIGKVTKIQGSTVHIKNDNGDTFKGPLNRATVREAVENLDEAPAHQNPRITAFGGMKAAQNTPSMQRYYDRLKKEREERAAKAGKPLPKPSDDLKGGKRPEKKLESVEHLDELKTSTIRSYVKKAQDDNQKRAMRIVDRDRLDLVHGSEMRKLRKRGLGVARAKAELDLRKITKRESVEQVDEINRDTLTSYIGKAKGDIEGIKNVLGSTGKQGPVSDRHREDLKRELGNRTRGRRTAIRKKYVTDEEVEHLDEVSPPGFEGTVKAMKKRHSDKIDNPWALAWWMKNKGYKSHKKADGTNKEEK